MTFPGLTKRWAPCSRRGREGPRPLTPKKVVIKQVMLVCQRENGVNMKYSDPDGFGCPGMMGLLDLYSSDTLNRAKMQLPSGSVDANFCPCCTFWSTNNETSNNHVRKHYEMGLTCWADGFMTASMAAMKVHMESEHGYKGKRASVVNEAEGKRLKQRLARCCFFSRTVCHTVLRPATTHAHAGVDNFVCIDTSNRHFHQWS